MSGLGTRFLAVPEVAHAVVLGGSDVRGQRPPAAGVACPGGLSTFYHFLKLNVTLKAGEEAERELKQGLDKTWRRALGSLLGCPKHRFPRDTAGLWLFQAHPFGFFQN